VNTEIIENIPMVIPSNESTLLILFMTSAWVAKSILSDINLSIFMFISDKLEVMFSIRLLLTTVNF